MSGTPQARFGTSAFTAAGWPGTFYPQGMKPAEYLSFYARHFDTVEVDSTYYATPSVQTVQGWDAKTPPGFLFAAKVPQVVTHEKILAGCDDEFKEFVERMQVLGQKLGVLLLQLPYFNAATFARGDDFLQRLEPFIKKLPEGVRFALEIRNKHWLTQRLFDLLRSRGVALALIDHPWMPRPAELATRWDVVTADFCYVRFLGDRKAIEERTKIWNQTIVDRRVELSEWAKVCYQVKSRGVTIFAYANNHYAGHGPATVRLFQELWNHQEKSVRGLSTGDAGSS